MSQIYIRIFVMMNWQLFTKSLSWFDNEYNSEAGYIPIFCPAGGVLRLTWQTLGHTILLITPFGTLEIDFGNYFGGIYSNIRLL